MSPLFVFIISIAVKVNYKPKKSKLNIFIRLISLIAILTLLIVFFKTNMIDYFDFENNLDLEEDMGIYVFTNRYEDIDAKNHHNIYYVGQTIDYRTRFYHHHKAEELMKLKPNCLAIWACEDDNMDSIEKELIEKWKPELNIQNNDKK